MRIVRDAWHPQVDRVIRTVSMLAGEVVGMGHTVEVMGPDWFHTVAIPIHSSIAMALFPGRRPRGHDIGL